ncbi:hypothetical protein F5877DRAFT_84306 [Lentinula edodes]|nr:hypothetical protein F5877DRAFT_84306 [Lentinula edodes]
MLPIPLPSTQIAGNMSYHVYMPIILKELGFKVTERFPIIHLTPSSPLSTSTPPSSFPSLPTREFCVLMIHDIRGFMGITHTDDGHQQPGAQTDDEPSSQGSKSEERDTPISKVVGLGLQISGTHPQYCAYTE